MAFKVETESIVRREVTGELVTGDTDTVAELICNSDPGIMPICLNDDKATPDTPIPDVRIEKYLSEVVDQNISTTEDYYRAYKKYVVPVTGVSHIDKAAMRAMMMKPRVRERLKFLRDSEWELNRPNLLGITRRFEALIEDEDLRPADKINALNSLAKVAGLITKENEDGGGNNRVTVTFNMQERPRDMKNVVDVEAQ